MSLSCSPGSDAIRAQASCCDDHDPHSLPVPVALARIQTAVQPVTASEQVALRAALGRVLAADVVSPIDVPAHVNSAMDGYAVRAADLPDAGTVTLAVVGTAFAGAAWDGRLASGQAVRIMTGAVLPEGADCVVMQEQTEREQGGDQEGGQDRVRIGRGHRAGQNIRLAGEDLKTGETVLAAGRRVQPADLGVLASLGVAEVRVRRRLRVAFFSTGDELRSIGEPLAAGCVYDSNRYSLYGMLSRLGVELIDMGVVRDDREALQAAFREAAACADAVITSGGVSVGEADFVKDTLLSLGRIDFWKLAMKPGRPLAFGRLGEAVFFGLPGNPVSVVVTFYQFVQPALRRMMGMNAVQPVTLQVPTLARLKKRPGRTDFQRGVLEQRDDGSMAVRPTGDQGSGILSSVSRADCFIVLAADSSGVEAGDTVTVQPFEGLF